LRQSLVKILNKYQGFVGSFTPAGDFRHPDICSQEQEEGIYTQYVTFLRLFLMNPNTLKTNETRISAVMTPGVKLESSLLMSSSAEP